MKYSPTQRSVRYLRDKGYSVAVVEKWNAHMKIRQDLWGFADLLAFNSFEVLLVQVTTSDNMAARIKKIRLNKTAPKWLNRDLYKSYRRIEVHGWSKKGARGKRKTWQVRIENITYDKDC